MGAIISIFKGGAKEEEPIDIPIDFNGASVSLIFLDLDCMQLFFYCYIRDCCFGTRITCRERRGCVVTGVYPSNGLHLRWCVLTRSLLLFTTI